MKLRFYRGSNYIDVFLDGRVLTFITPLYNHQPVTINLDKLDEHKERIKKMNIDKKILKELSELKTEKDMEEDLIKDMKQNGWEYKEI